MCSCHVWITLATGALKILQEHCFFLHFSMMYDDLMLECEKQEKFRKIQVSVLTLSIFDSNWDHELFSVVLNWALPIH